MSHYQDISGQTFNKLTAIERCGYKHGRTAWKCQCECGNIIIATAHDLKQNRVKQFRDPGEMMFPNPYRYLEG